MTRFDPAPPVERRGETSRLRQTLHEGWRLAIHPDARKQLGTDATEIAATVPGCVHTDLLAAGLVPDPLLERNEAAMHWIGGSDWTYRVRFACPAATPGEQVDLVFEGLDTVADVVLNGRRIAHTENQHRTYRFAVGTLLRSEGNDLEVRFASPVAHAERRRDEVGDLPNPYGEPYNFIRKMACNFGWDWGPRLTTSGIWRSVVVERWHGARLAAVRPTATVVTPRPVAGEGGRVDVVVELERTVAPATAGADGTVRIDAELFGPGGGSAGSTTVTVDADTAAMSIDVAAISRWWPHGRGDQPMYSLDVTLLVDGVVTDETTRRIGFRDVQLDTSAENGAGTRFAVVVNGERLWVRGFNWIPDDCFPSRMTRERTCRRIDQAVAANANLLRVWGGGIYETDDFYAYCDERGVLVWQDFLFACAAYPEELLAQEVTAEATDAVDRLMSHPSLVVWNGNNESLQGWHDWGWKELVGDRTWGEAFYRQLLPSLTAAKDPGRHYLDGSPTSLDATIPPNDPAHGTVHVWDVWNDLDYVHYRDHRPRFVAEFGFQGPPAWATFQHAFADRVLSIDDPGVMSRQRAFDGHAKLERWLQRHVGEVTDYDDWLYGAQVNQAHAVEVGVGHFRSLHERCSGVVWWQLNDCWASVSWSVVDGDGRRKPAWYAIRRTFADRLAVLALDRGCLVLVNDGLDEWCDIAQLSVVAADGSVGRATAVEFTVAPGASHDVVVPVDLRARLAPGELVMATVDGRHIVDTGADAQPQHALAPDWDVEVTAGSETVIVEVTATSLVRDLCLFADRVDPEAIVDDQLITLLADETHRFTVATCEVDVPRWLEAVRPVGGPSRVLRAAGDRRPLGALTARRSMTGS